MASFCLDDEPTITNLQDIKNGDGLDVFDTIAAKDFSLFGMRLLKDDNGTKVDLILKDERAKGNGNSSVVRKILQEWLDRGGDNLTYHHLIDCIRKSGMGAFAERIEAMAKKGTGKAQPRSADKRAQCTVNVSNEDSRAAPPTATHPVTFDGDEATDHSIIETPLFDLTADFKKKNKALTSPSEVSAVKDFATKVKVVIQTCNDAEYYAALEKLKSPEIKNHVFTKPVEYPDPELTIVVGTFAGVDAAVIKTEQGAKCKTELEAVFENVCTNATLLLGLGVCYGLKKEHDLKFADVLVGKKIEAIQTPKFGADGVMDTRGEVKVTPRSVQKMFCEDADLWDDFIVCEEPSKRFARAFVGLLASVSILINDPRVIQGLKNSPAPYLGGEMEGWAQIEYTPERVKCIIIKGIADFADGTKNKVWQLTAAKAAVNYAHYKLKQDSRAALPTSTSPVAVDGDEATDESIIDGSIDPQSRKRLTRNTEHRNLSNDSPNKIEVRKTAGAHGSRPSMLPKIGLCVLIFAVVSLLIFLSINNLTTTVKPSAANECHKIDQSTNVHLYLKQEDFNIASTKEFGLFLKLTNAELDNLKDESGGKGTEFLNKVLDMWYKKAPAAACWETIYDALWKLPNRPLANKVKKEYMKD